MPCTHTLTHTCTHTHTHHALFNNTHPSDTFSQVAIKIIHLRMHATQVTNPDVVSIFQTVFDEDYKQGQDWKPWN